MNNNNIKYKDSHFGLIPSDWEISSFASVCEKLLDGTHFSPQSKNGPYKYITSKNIRDDGLNLENLDYISEQEHKEIYKRCPVKFNDILLTKDGASTGACCMNTLTEEFSLLSSVAILRSDGVKMCNEFLIHFIKSPLGQKIIQDEISGQAITRITLEKIKSFRIITPPLSEQKAIAHILSLLDIAVNKNNSLIAKNELLKKWLMQNLLTGKKRLSGFHKVWRKCSANDFLSLRNEQAINDGKIPLFSLTIEDGVTEKSERYEREFLVKDKAIKKYKVVYPNDIVFNPANIRWGAIAKHKRDFKVLLSPIYEIIPVKAGYNIDFVSYLVSSPRQIAYYASIVEGTLIERMAVKAEPFLAIKYLIPEYEEQKAIAQVLKTADNENQLLKTKTERLREQKKGLMQVLLTGKKRLTI